MECITACIVIFPKEDGILSYASDKDVEGDIRKAMSCAAAINHARHLGNSTKHMHPEDVANDAKRMAGKSWTSL